MRCCDVVGYTADADTYCEDCARKRYGDLNGEDSEGNELGAIFADSEWDHPVHCADCGAHLECTLTADGVAYAIEAIVRDLAIGRTDSVACQDWAPFVGVSTDLAPDPYADRFAIVQGAYWACADYHAGQASRGYRHLSKLGRYYHPGACEGSPSLEGDALAAYVRVAVSLTRNP